MADKKNDKKNDKSSKKDNNKPAAKAAPVASKPLPKPTAATVKPSKPAPVKMGGSQPTSTIGKAPGAPVNTGGKNPKPNPDMPVEKKAKDVDRHPSGQVKNFKAKTAQNNNKLAEAKRFIANANSQPTSGMAGPQGGDKYQKAQKIITKARIQNKQALRQGYKSPQEMVQARKADKVAAQQPTRPGATAGGGVQQNGKLIRTPAPRPPVGVVAATPVASGIRPTAPVAPAPAAPAPAAPPPKIGGPPPSTAMAGKGTQAPKVAGNAGAPTSAVTGIQPGTQTSASIAANSAVAAGQRGRGSFRFR